MTNFFSSRFSELQLEPREEKADAEVRLVEEILGTGRKTILDVGCGIGRHGVRLAQRGHTVVGIDVNREYVAVATRRAAELRVDVSFRVEDDRQMTFSNEFDGVLSFYTTFGYHSDEENIVVLRNIASALRAGGHFILEMLN